MLISVRTAAASAPRTDSTTWTNAIAPEAWIVAAITGIAAILRFATITSQSYWVDEATTAHYMHLSFGALLHQVRVNETTPPLYYVIAWLWAKVFGAGEAGLRSLSALLGTALIPITYLCGRELVSRWAGIVAAGLAAVSPFMIWYSQEARSYMLFAALSGLSLLFFARARRDPATRNIVLWAVFSALAVMTHFFAAFLVAPEALWLLFALRNRTTLLAAGAVAAVQAALVPLAASDTSHPLGWITRFPLSVRIEQIPVNLGFASLYQSSLVTKGLWGAGILAAVVLGLLWFGAERHERRGAAIAAGLAAVVILVPLVLAEAGSDYLVPRNFTPAWIPLAVLIGAACTASRTLPVGAALAALLLGAFVWADVRIGQDSTYQRPDWRGVAAALGSSAGPRAIVAYDGLFAAEPLAIYLKGVPWTQPSHTPVAVDEVDVVGSVWQTPANPLPSGTRLLGTKAVEGFRVARFAVTPPWQSTLSAIGARAGSLLPPTPALPGVLIQRGTASG
jgi:4-amino-4-deoxy-L-arabinose transferase-like glycosyltransferase